MTRMFSGVSHSDTKIKSENVMNVLNRLVKSALVVALSLAVLPLTATAQTFPDKPIKILCPFPPGGGTDFVSRIVGAKLAELTGWQVIVENKPGAGGNLAIEFASKTPADGYTLVMGQTDNMMLGPQNNLPDTFKVNKGRNTFFFLPLILGIMGRCLSEILSSLQLHLLRKHPPYPQFRIPTSLREDFHAKHFPKQENNLASKMRGEPYFSISSK